MSKQRPSRRDAARTLAQPPEQARSARSWLRHVFHNCYTRRGRRIALRGWSVKLQHQGQRRTFALVGKTRAAAAAEARAIHEILRTEGWEGIERQAGRRSGRVLPRTDVRYWRERLLVRNHPAPVGSAQEFSVRIDHDGEGFYFPLGVTDPEVAATLALAIYRAVVRHGWEKARRRFPREVTLGFQWGRDPLLWTYTTVRTVVGRRPAASNPNTENPVVPGHVRVVEDDPGIRQALEQCLNPCDGLSVLGHPNGKRARAGTSDEETLLCLVNRDLAAKMGLANPEQVCALPGGIPALTYGVHPDSEELFALTPGGLSGYVLKRVPPARILEPMQDVLAVGRTSADVMTRVAHSYFQRLLESDPAGEAVALPRQLTRREQEVIELLRKGCVEKEIAQALAISTWTVHEHVKRIFEKLQVHSRTEAVLAYLQK